MSSDIRISATVSQREILKLLMTFLIDLWSYHHTVTSFSSVVSRLTIDATYTGWIVMDRGILHLRLSSSRILQPVDAFC